MKVSILAAAGLFASAATAADLVAVTVDSETVPGELDVTITSFGSSGCHQIVTAQLVPVTGVCLIVDGSAVASYEITGCPVVDCECEYFSDFGCKGTMVEIEKNEFGPDECVSFGRSVFHSAFCTSVAGGGGGVGQQ